jgi:hypothetical protein
MSMSGMPGDIPGAFFSSSKRLARRRSGSGLTFV